MSAKEVVLGNIRKSLGAKASAPPIVRKYAEATELTREEVVEQFADRLRDYNATVHFCGASEIAATVAGILRGRGKAGVLVPSGIPREWLPEGFAFCVDEGLTYAELDASEGVLTGCDAAIALTGTIVIAHSAGQGRRALTLVPDFHLCVVPLELLVATVPEGMRRMAELLPAPLTTISGPSATSDIEMIRIKGVHGPRTLEVILVA